VPVATEALAARGAQVARLVLVAPPTVTSAVVETAVAAVKVAEGVTAVVVEEACQWVFTATGAVRSTPFKTNTPSAQQVWEDRV
jgi:hypothetical protein